MSVPMYTRMPPIPPLGPYRRYPFANANAVNHAPRAPETHKPHEKAQEKPTEKPQEPQDLPLPRQNTKAVPPSPPKVIVDKSKSSQYTRVGLLGEGGFARVYEVVDVRRTRLACKVVTKASLKTKKAKTKLYAEIKIHRALSHPNIVRFIDCFEDEENVYMTIDLCPNGSLMDLLRRRKRFTEPEARFFMVQVLGACHYMHTHQVIHRDLKLGNLFLDANMNVKVGDFGLAALIENEGDRKKTICGTPNYIAPEVLFDTANGHSFEVDVWSIGVILYTFVVGHPPFQTKEVKSIYKRIRENQYEFPIRREISTDARGLIQLILTPDPQQRPSLHEILDHSFFMHGIVPSHIPTTVHDIPPNFIHISRQMSRANLAKLRRRALLDEDQISAISLPQAPNNTANGARMKGQTATLAQQEKEFQQAVQPGSPISALLISARQPLVIAPAGRGESPLYKKLQAAAKEKRSSPLKMGNLHDIQEEIVRTEGRGYKEKDYDVIRKKELESQKARIVAQMAPPGSATGSDSDGKDNQENIVPFQIKGHVKEIKKVVIPEPQLPQLKPNGFDAAAETLTLAFEALAAKKLFKNTKHNIQLSEQSVFIASWVDFCNKYGMGYALTDGSVGVYFNDSTSLVLSPNKHHIEYIMARCLGTVYVRKYYTVGEYPEDLQSKVYLLKHYEQYIMDRLHREREYTYQDTNKTKGMDFLQKFLRMKNVIVFKMSNDVLQFNFYDHSKMILSSQGLMVTHIDKETYKLTTWRLSDIMAQALKPPVEDPNQAKFNRRLVDKLNFCKEVLLSIRAASDVAAGSADVGGEVNAPEPKMTVRPSKTSLR